jgi:peroxiredoxin
MRNVIAMIVLLALIAWGVYDLKDKKPAVSPPAAAAAENAVPGVQKGNLAPDFQLTDLDGKPVRLSDYRGRKVVLNFWASWCYPCKMETPHMEEFYEKYRSNNFIILGVNVTNTEASPEDARKFAREYKLSYPVLLDEKGEVTDRYQVVGYPTTLVIDSKGVIREKFQGAIDYETLKKAADKID